LSSPFLRVHLIDSVHHCTGQPEGFFTEFQPSGFTELRHGDNQIVNASGEHFEPYTLQQEGIDLGGYKTYRVKRDELLPKSDLIIFRPIVRWSTVDADNGAFFQFTHPLFSYGIEKSSKSLIDLWRWELVEKAILCRENATLEGPPVDPS